MDAVYEIKIDYKKIGERIQKKRLELGLTQEQASFRANMTSRHWSNIESNNIGTISFKALFAIATALKTDIDYFLTDSMEKNEKIVNKEIQEMIDKMSQKKQNSVNGLNKINI